MEDLLIGFYRILVHSPTISLAGSVEGIKTQQTSEHELIQSHEIIHFIIFLQITSLLPQFL